MGQAFWTGVRLPSSPPELSRVVKNVQSFFHNLFYLAYHYIDKFKYIEYNKYMQTVKFIYEQ